MRAGLMLLLIYTAPLAGCAGVQAQAAGSSAARGPLAGLGWLAGCWRYQEQGDRSGEECWTEPRGGAMLGTGTTQVGGRTVFFEFMRIVADDKGVVVYRAWPKGERGTDFRLLRRGRREVVFANPAHDFPQRIAYRREGERLIAETSGVDRASGKRRASRWVWRRAQGGR